MPQVEAGGKQPGGCRADHARAFLNDQALTTLTALIINRLLGTLQTQQWAGPPVQLAFLPVFQDPWLGGNEQRGALGCDNARGTQHLLCARHSSRSISI